VYTGRENGWYERTITAPYSPKARSHVSSIPARMPGAASGTATLANLENSECPRVDATSSIAGSTVAKAERAATMRKGAEQKV
jgi:hypothetical protein